MLRESFASMARLAELMNRRRRISSRFRSRWEAVYILAGLNTVGRGADIDAAPEMFTSATHLTAASMLFSSSSPPEMLMLVSAFSALLLASTPSPSVSTRSVPPVMSSVVAASMPSPEAETVTSPPLTVMKPFAVLIGGCGFDTVVPGGDNERARLDLDGVRAAQAVVDCVHGDIAALNFQVVFAGDAVVYIAVDGQLAAALNVKVVLGEDGRTGSVRRRGSTLNAGGDGVLTAVRKDKLEFVGLFDHDGRCVKAGDAGVIERESLSSPRRRC